MANKSNDGKSKPAGINDNIDIAVMDINNVVENNKYVLKLNNGVKIPDLSTELIQGMTIKAYDGGKIQEEVR